MKLDSALIEGFVGSCLAKNFQNSVVSPAVHREWWDLCCSEDRFVAIAAPRKHAKSTAITLAYVLAAVLFRDKSYVVIISDTEGQATLFLNDIKRELVENEDITTLFGVEKIEKDQETDIIVRMTDKHKFRIVAKGSEQRVRGMKWRGQRPDLVIGDDLENDEIVMNPDRRDKFRRWMNGAVLPILSKEGVIRIVGTILHIDSYLENRMPRLQSKNTVIEPLKIWSKSKIGAWRSVKYKAHDDNFEHILWSEMFDETWFRETRADLVSQGQADIYNQEYLNYPIDESRALFRRSDLLPITDDKLNLIISGRIPLNYYIGIDLAFGEHKRRDWCAFVVVATDADNIMYVVEVIRARLDSREVVDLMLDLQAKYNPQWMVIEKGMLEKSIGPFLREEMFKRDQFIQLETITPSVDKSERARSIIGRVRIHGVRFFKDADWYATFETELCQFPRGQHDDQVDAFSLIGLSLMKVINALTDAEKEEEEYEEEKKRSGYYTDNDGRSKWTGY